MPLRRIWTWLIYGGSRVVRDYERVILDFVSSTLSSDDREALATQLANLDHLKRLHADRMVTFYFPDSLRVKKLSDINPERVMARLALKTQRTVVKAKVVSHEGLLSSIEFAKSPTHLQGAEVQLEALPKPRGKEWDLPSELDAEEHGEEG